MATSYKNIVITPNISNTSDPKIQFSGANSSVNTDITLNVYPASNGTLSFEGSAGQLFSITNDLSNSIFAVNDVSGIPSLEIFANGLISVAPFGGNVVIGNTADFILSTNTTVIANGTGGTSGQFLTTNGTAAYWSSVTLTAGAGLTGGGDLTTTRTFDVGAANGITVAADSVAVTQGTGVVVNTSGVHVNATYIGTLSANNADYLDGQHGTYYQNATNINTGTLPWAQAPTGTVNTSGNFTLSGNTTLAGTNTTISSNVNVTGTFLNVASAFIANSTGAYHTGTVNAASFTTTGIRANTTGIYPTSNTSGDALGNTISRWELYATTGTFGGAVSGITTLGTGNTTITGTLGVTQNSTFSTGAFFTNTSLASTTDVTKHIALDGNGTTSGFNFTSALGINYVVAPLAGSNGSHNFYVGTTQILKANSVVLTVNTGAGIYGPLNVISSTFSAGNTTITGFANISGDISGANVDVDFITIGNSAPQTVAGVGSTPKIQLHNLSTSMGAATFSGTNWGNNTTGPGLYMTKTRGNTVGTYAATNNNDILGEIRWGSSNSSSFVQAATILSRVDGAVANGTTTNAAAHIIFETGNTSIGSPTERMRISSNGFVGIGTQTPTSTLDVTGSLDVSTNTFILGTSTNAASGYTILPNNLKMNWGSVVANSVGVNAVTFTSAFTTNAYGLSLTIFGANSAVGTVAKANTISRTGFTVVCGNTTALNNTNISSVYYMAIGPA